MTDAGRDPSGAVVDAEQSRRIADWHADIAQSERRPTAKRPGGRPRKDGAGRWRRLSCPSCGFIAYASAAALRRAGLPACACGDTLALTSWRDRLAVDEDGTLADLARLAPAERIAALRADGLSRDETAAIARYLWTGDQVRADERRRNGAGAHDERRCEYGSCTRWTAGRYCAEHSSADGRPELAPARRSL